jgi:hypothetical protein
VHSFDLARVNGHWTTAIIIVQRFFVLVEFTDFYRDFFFLFITETKE